jgi:hypothetical protein
VSASPPLVIKTADELGGLHSAERRAARRASRESPLMRTIYTLFAERGGPIPAAVIAAAHGERGTALARALHALDDDDLIRVRDGVVDVAYPFSTAPTAFVVELADGRVRYACCALDALGIAPMLGRPVVVRSRCHQSGEPLRVDVAPSGVATEARAMMVWFGARDDERARVMDGL